MGPGHNGEARRRPRKEEGASPARRRKRCVQTTCEAPRAVAAAGHTAGWTHVEELGAPLLRSGQSSGEPERGGRARAGPRGGNPEAEAGF